MSLTQALREIEPVELEQLLNALTCMDGSLYRAAVLADQPKPMAGGRTPTLQWQGFTQDTLLMMQVANTLETVRCMLARFLGSKTDAPAFIYPPDYVPPSTAHDKTAGEGDTPDAIIAGIASLFSMAG